MKTSLLLIFLIFFTIVAFSQEYMILSYRDIITTQDLTSIEADMRTVEVSGTPYLYNEYKSCKLYSHDHNLYGIDVKFNVYNACFEFENEDKQYSIPNIMYDSILFSQNEKFIPVTVAVKHSKVKIKPMFVLSQIGDNYLLKDFRIAFLDAKAKGPYSDELPPRYINNIPDYYLFINGKGLIPIKSMTKLNSEFSNKKIKNFASENNIDKRDEKDLIKLFDYIMK